MKKTILSLVLMLAVSPALAAGKMEKKEAQMTAPVSSGAPSDAYWGLGLVLDAPMQNFNPDFNLGWGGRLTAGCALDKGLDLQLTADNLYFSSREGSVYDLRLIPQLKGLVGMGGWQLYLTAGPGMDFEFAQGVSTKSLDLMFGPGAQFGLGGGSNLFLEWDFNFIFGNNVTGLDMPLVAGLTFPL